MPLRRELVWNTTRACCCALFAICAPLLLHSAQAAAQPDIDDGTRAAARELGQQGIDAYLAQDYAAANQKLEKAYQLYVTPTLGLWSARARMQLGQWVEAAERYRETLRAPVAVGDNAVQQHAHDEAAAELDALVPRLPSLTAELEDAAPASVALELDGKTVSSDVFGVARPANPGPHRIVVTRGEQRVESQVQLAEKEHKVVSLRLSPAAPVPAAPVAVAQLVAAAPSPDDSGSSLARPLAIAGFALGGVGLATAGVTALMANGRCSGGRCMDEAQQSSYATLRSVSSVAFWAGAACVVGGVVAWLAAPAARTEQVAELSWDVGPMGVTVRGAL